MERMSNELPFEEALAKLEEIVQKMEDPFCELRGVDETIQGRFGVI